MKAQEIIHAVANDADGFLAGISSMTEARAAIREHLKIHHPDLGAPEEAHVIAGVLAILEEEGFFEGAAGGGEADDTVGGGSDDEP